MDEPNVERLTKAMADVVDAQPKMFCPNCNKEIHLMHVAKIPERQVMHLKLTSGTGAWSAQTIGSVITEFDKLLKAVAKDVGGKVHVFIDTIERSEKDLDIGFLITTVQPNGNKKSKSGLKSER